MKKQELKGHQIIIVIYSIVLIGLIWSSINSINKINELERNNEILKVYHQKLDFYDILGLQMNGYIEEYNELYNDWYYNGNNNYLLMKYNIDQFDGKMMEFREINSDLKKYMIDNENVLRGFDVFYNDLFNNLDLTLDTFILNSFDSKQQLNEILDWLEKYYHETP